MMAVEQNGLPTGCCGQLIMASPDVDASVAPQLISAIAPHFQGVTLYANNLDVALYISNRKAGDEPRLGELQPNGLPLLLSGMDSIDATAVPFSFFDFNHNAYVANSVLLHDIGKLVLSGNPEMPNLRSKQLLLIRVRTAPGRYWRFVSR
jgi:esterase/lipase superfamily enzyme